MSAESDSQSPSPHVRAGCERALPLFRARPHPCSYLPGRTATDVFSLNPRIDSATYRRLMDRGFRRSGTVFYRPDCEGCRECVPIRVPVSRFRPSRSQRRVLRRNLDVRVEFGPPRSTDEKWNVYVAYLRARHSGSMSEDREAFDELLYRSPIDSIEVACYVGRRLLGAGIIDVCPGCLSSVYFYYDPAFADRSPGVFSALCEIEECRRRGLDYWYIGFYIRDSRLMNYKAQYRPYELLGADGVWCPGPLLPPANPR